MAGNPPTPAAAVLTQKEIEDAAYVGAKRARKESREQLEPIFLDLLFALSLGAVFTGIAQNPSSLTVPEWSQLLVAGLLITLSWFGFRWSRAEHPMHVTRVSDLRFLQTMIDVGIVALYFVLAEYAVNTNATQEQTLESMGLLIMVIFFCYLAWDVVQLKAVPDDATRIWRLVTTAVFVAVMFFLWIVIYLCEISDTWAIVAMWVIYGVALFVYRVIQGFVTERGSGAEGT